MNGNIPLRHGIGRHFEDELQRQRMITGPPAEGDPVWQIPPGTPFSELPAHWTCPNCACEKQKFLVLDD